jgi:excisionase family DNA binding protein
MSKTTDRFIEARDGERKARAMLQEIVDRFLKVAERLHSWQTADSGWRHDDKPHPVRRSDDPTKDPILSTDIPTIYDVQAAVKETDLWVQELQAAIAGLTPEERQALCDSDKAEKAQARASSVKGPTSEYISASQAAKRLGLSRQRVSVLLREGRIPFKVSGGRYMIKRDDLEQFAANRPMARPMGKIF